MRPALFILSFLVAGCGDSLIRPYKCGPVLTEKDIQIFRKVNTFLDLRAGDTYADIGASSGYYDGAMAVFLDSVDLYIQDIDQHCLTERNLKRVVRYYSRFRKTPDTNHFHVTIGDEKKTNLPRGIFDKIYCNATFHVLQYPDAIVSDLYTRLRPDGKLFIRDEFVYHGETRYCDAKQCRNLIPQFEDFLAIMERNGFRLTGQSDDLGDYPIYRFEKMLGL